MTTHDDYVVDNSRVALYFDKYQYKCTLFITDIQYFRSIKEERSVDNYATNLIHQSYWQGNMCSLTDIKLFVSWREISESSGLDVKIRVQHHQVDVYFNDVTIAKTVSTVFTGRTVGDNIKLFRVDVRADYERGVIYRAKPKHKFRIYLKSRRYSTEQKTELLQFLVENRVRMSDSLANWCQRNISNYAWSGGYWAWDYLCFDYDDEYLATLMALKFDNVIRKICRIEKK